MARRQQDLLVADDGSADPRLGLTRSAFVTQAAVQTPSAPYTPVTNLVLHYNGSGALTTGDNDMLMSDPIGTDNRTNKDLPEQVPLMHCS